MKWLERMFLGLMTAVAPVYIACAYGSPFAYHKDGRVVDVSAISTGSLALDIAIGIGGVPRGRLCPS